TGRGLGLVKRPLGELDFRRRMSERFGLPVGVANDANCATYAEHVVGAGRGSRTMVMLTLGTGVGGGVVIDGELFRGWAELGHTVVGVDGGPGLASCPAPGRLERRAS